MAERSQRVLDARPDRLDLRDLPYRPPLRSLPPRFPTEAHLQQFLPGYVAANLILDQGKQGACTGFGLACVANYLFWVRHAQEPGAAAFERVSPRMFYELAKRYDEWPGTDYEGSSCRGALKGWHKHGVCADALWPYPLSRGGKPKFVSPQPQWSADAAQRPLGVYYRIDRHSIVDIQAAIADIGAVYVSGLAHDGWEALTRSAKAALPAPATHDALPEIGPIVDRKSRGGHAFALVGYNERGFIVQNSWGVVWGAAGFGVLPYDDWIVNATDAWAVALGVPAFVRSSGGKPPRAIVSSAWRMGSGTSLTSLDPATRQPNNPPEDPWPFDHPFNFADYEPWRTSEAYGHTLVTGNEGVLMPTEFTLDPSQPEALARQIVRSAPQMWLAAQPAAQVLRLAIYAHGGLNSEEESIQRIRVLGPCFEANGIYPLFIAWKTGVGETIANMVEDATRRRLGDEVMRSQGLLDLLGEAKDRMVETIAHVLCKGLWTQMRENAAASAKKGHGLDLLVRNLLDLQSDLAAQERTLEVHLVGHSAGSILIGHLASSLASERPAAAPAIAIASTSLMAAACSCTFANQHFVAAQAAGVLQLEQLHLYVLTDENEKADGLPTPRVPAYGKSLLYMVSRALDDVHKMPLLGMERAQMKEYENNTDQWERRQLRQLQQWRSAWPGEPAGLLHRVTAPQVPCTREDGRTPSTHGSFDNNIPVIAGIIGRIRGAPLVSPLEWLDYG